MNRKVSNVNVGGDTVRHRVVILDDESVPGTQVARARFFQLLRWMADNQHLLACGYNEPQRVLITHNGTQWQIEAEAEVDHE